MKLQGEVLKGAARVVLLLLPLSLWAQSGVAQAAKAAQKEEAQKAGKKPHVWTNDDLPKATEATVSVPSVVLPPSLTGEQGKTGEGAQPAAAQPGAPAKPVMDVKVAEEKVKDAQSGVERASNAVRTLEDRLNNDSDQKSVDADREELSRAQDQLAAAEAALEQAQKDYAAQKGQEVEPPGAADAPPAASPSAPPSGSPQGRTANPS